MLPLKMLPGSRVAEGWWRSEGFPRQSELVITWAARKGDLGKQINKKRAEADAKNKQKKGKKKKKPPSPGSSAAIGTDDAFRGRGALERQQPGGPCAQPHGCSRFPLRPFLSPVSPRGSLQKGHGAFPAQGSPCCKPSTYLQALPSLHADPQQQPSASGEPGTALRSTCSSFKRGQGKLEEENVTGRQDRGFET